MARPPPERTKRRRWTGFVTDSESNPDPWRTTVVSTRVRLARNVRGHRFPGKASETEREDAATLVRRAVRRLPVELGAPYAFHDLLRGDPSQWRLAARDRWLPVPSGGAGASRWLLRDRSGAVSILVNDEDHLRVQAGGDGWCPDAMVVRALPVADALERELDFATDARWGYLTASPGNMGSGFRISALMHLPALAWEGRLGELLGAARTLDIAVRGVEGEGSAVTGDFVQVSNAVAFGRPLGAIVDRVAAVAQRLMEAELAERERLFTRGTVDFRARLRHARTQVAARERIDRTEALEHLSLERLVGLSERSASCADLDFCGAVRQVLADRSDASSHRAAWLRGWIAVSESGAADTSLR